MAKYTVDDECCRNIDAYIKQTQSTIDTLVQIHSSHDFSNGKSFNKVLKEYGLGVEAVAGGGMSSAAAKKAECYKEVIREIESSTTINATMAIQLALIGGHGYYNPVSWLIHDKGYAHAQWMLTRLVIEITRVSWKLAKLKQIKDLCKKRHAAAGKDKADGKGGSEGTRESGGKGE
jgi:hypothetical protein